MADTLREFLITLGWDVDKNLVQQHKFEASIESATLRATLLGEVLVDIARKIAGVVAETTNKFGELFNSAQRLNTTAALANDFPLMIKKYGGNPNEASALLEQATAKLKGNMNYLHILNELGFGVNAETGKLEIQQTMLENLRHVSVQQIESYTTLMGLPDQPILLMKRHIDEILPDLKAFEEYRGRLGVSIEQQAVDGKAFDLVWQSVSFKLNAIYDKISAGFQKAFTPLLTEFDKFLTVNAKAIGEALTTVINALLAMFKSWRDDFDVVLQDQNNTKTFAENIKLLAENIAWLAKKMQSLVSGLRELLMLPDVLNYLSGNTSNMESYNRGRDLIASSDNPYGQINRAINPTLPDVSKRLEEQKAAPEWGPAKRFREWAKGKLGMVDKTAPAASANGVAARPNTVVFGDSIGEGLAGAIKADKSNTQQGMGTDWVAKKILAYQGSLRGKDVVISSGASNDTRNAMRVQTQIQNAIDMGADPKRITVLGVGSLNSAVGNYPGASEQINSALKDAATKAGATYLALPNGTDVHPNYSELAGGLRSVAPTASAAPAAQLPKPSPFGQLAPFNAPPINPRAFATPPASGVTGDTNINAPANVTINIDGTGDPTAVAHLVKGAQKSVNADLSRTLENAAP